MKNYALTAAIALAALMALTGCSVTAQCRIRNSTGQKVVVTSGHTQKAIVIPVGSVRCLQHMAGAVTVDRVNGTKWLYKNLSPLQFKGTSYATFDKGLFSSSLSIDVVIENDGKIYVIADSLNVTKDNYRNSQPSGFPLIPSE